jgi:hypothetical protein
MLLDARYRTVLQCHEKQLLDEILILFQQDMKQRHAPLRWNWPTRDMDVQQKYLMKFQQPTL